MKIIFSLLVLSLFSQTTYASSYYWYVKCEAEMYELEPTTAYFSNVFKSNKSSKKLRRSFEDYLDDRSIVSCEALPKDSIEDALEDYNDDIESIKETNAFFDDKNYDIKTKIVKKNQWKGL